MRKQAGFAAVEVLVGAAIGVALLASALATLSVHVRVARAHPGSVDIAERARALFDVVFADLTVAGSGFAVDASATALSCCLPAISPRRLGFRNADPPGTARADVVTIVFVPRGAVGARLAAPIAGAGAPLELATGPPCPTSSNCGISDRDDVLVFDGTGRHDYFRASVTAGATTVSARQSTVGSAYDVGSYAARVETRTYYFDEAASQLRIYDGYLADVPAIDNVAAFRVEYWGEDRQPIRPRPPAGTANCLYDATGALLPWPRALGGGTGLVPLAITEFADGPWCGAGDNRFDADLLRVRRVRVSATLQAPDALRADGALFKRPGLANSALSLVRDLIVSIDVTPRSLGARR
jgi:hypothetical protein